MTTDPTDLTPEAALAALREPLTVYRASLDSAVSFADTTMHRLPVCSFTWSTLVRYWVWQEMKRQRPSEAVWRARRLNNNGMEISLNGHRVRPFKSLDAQPPAPGAGQTRQAYWQQIRQDTLELEFDDPVFVSGGVNLILDWTLGAQRSTVLALSKPTGIWRFRGKPNLAWRVIVNFGDAGAAPLRWQPSDDDGDDFDLRKKIDTSEIPLSDEA